MDPCFKGGRAESAVALRLTFIRSLAASITPPPSKCDSGGFALMQTALHSSRSRCGQFGVLQWVCLWAPMSIALMLSSGDNSSGANLPMQLPVETQFLNWPYQRDVV